ncbi:unnamed protein product [Prunus armeniaca]|uniref:Uncharacterized protein n=1 Tax=Prunus armeniaca TaxID=36596 RepID=A0A6J5VXW5_PRUAR|nr:unnamed protein product [Prunus armeniaca]CAB4294109.1 unnamed protein product [Prunus armeniaca]
MKTLIRQTQAKTEACGFRWEKAKAEMWPMCQDPAPRTVVVSQLSRCQTQRWANGIEVEAQKSHRYL